MDRYIYDIKDIMQIMKISRNTAYRLIKKEAIPHIRIGNRYKIPVERFNNWFSLYSQSETVKSPI